MAWGWDVAQWADCLPGTPWAPSPAQKLGVVSQAQDQHPQTQEAEVGGSGFQGQSVFPHISLLEGASQVEGGCSPLSSTFQKTSSQTYPEVCLLSNFESS